MEMTNNINHFKRKKKWYKKGRLFAWIDAVVWILILYVNLVPGYNGLYDQLVKQSPFNTGRRGPGSMIQIFTCWILVYALFFYMKRDIYFKKNSSKQELNKLSTMILYVSIFATAIAMFLFYWPLNNYVLKVTEPVLKEQLLIIFYVQYFLLLLYAGIRKLFSFDYYEFFYYKKRGYDGFKKGCMILIYWVILTFGYLLLKIAGSLF